MEGKKDKKTDILAFFGELCPKSGGESEATSVDGRAL